ncbi:hypothetical protein [Massilia sp. Se16.2.3]|uniref:hypothetical protein n=1 Tax=Massilia sp. Se16.2.3 TaxID=2709303 RepID=UPI001E35B86D|nr:hypothetical protein [Massilia sp. Se16.2.3]
MGRLILGHVEDAMRIKILNGLLATAVFGLIAGCGNTPLPPDRGCGVPGGLCAPAVPNTSAVRPPPPAEPERSETVTSPVELYPDEGNGPQASARSGNGARVALLLPLQSPALGRAADAVRAGFCRP